MSAELKILLVEDDATTRASMKRLIQQSLRPRALTEAASGEEALTRLRSDHYDLIVSDHLMGYLDGIGLLEIARRDHPQAARILVTGHADLDLARAAIDRAGVHAFLQKPLTVEALSSVLPSALERARNEARY